MGSVTDFANVGRIDATSAVESANAGTQRHGPLAVAPLLLALSIGARLAYTYLVPNAANFVDLHVYVGGAATLGTSHALYHYAYTGPTRSPLPFTYPPFAALVFYPLHLLPIGLVAFVWQLVTIAALYGVVRISQRLLSGQARSGAEPGGHRVAMLWTAVGIWLEPVLSNLNYGQVNVLLVLGVLYAVYNTRWWVSGLLVGLAAGVKLTPAVSSLYFIGVRRWGTAVFAAVVFAATVAISVLVLGDQARYYFTTLFGDSHRMGSVGAASNQSWRGGIARILGHDPGYGPLVVAVLALTAVLALLAWRAVGRDDRLGGIVVVALFGLLLSPISWIHHWVWLVPTIIWLLHGPARDRLGARVLGWGWLALTLLGPTWMLGLPRTDIFQISRPWYLAWAGLAYIVATLITLAWIAAKYRSPRLSAEPSPNHSP